MHWILVPKAFFFSGTLGNLSNHDDDGNKNPTNLHICQWKTVFLHPFVRAFFTFWHSEDVLFLSTTWNDQFCSCVDDVSIWWQMFNFVLFCPKRRFQFNSRIARTHFWSITTLNNWKIIAEKRSYIFTWRSRFRWRRVCLSSLVVNCELTHLIKIYSLSLTSWRVLSALINLTSLSRRPNYLVRPTNHTLISPFWIYDRNTIVEMMFVRQTCLFARDLFLVRFIENPSLSSLPLECFLDI